MSTKHGGVWPTMIAAFDEQGSLDFKANAEITDYFIKNGCDGLFAVCQSSEMFFLNLEEKVALAECIVKAADGRVPVIASGHTSEDINDQIKELEAISKTGVDAVILVSNRLAKEDEGTEVLMKNLKTILEALPDVTFGIYECPFPYRRLITDEELKWCAESGRITFLKDVSCDIEIEKPRVKIAEGSKLKLFNANTETLLDSLIAGYDGYNGVMGNFHIDIYKWLFENFEEQPELAREVQNDLTRVGHIEEMGYPVNAKCHMQLHDINMKLYSRRLSQDTFTQEQKDEVIKLIKWEKETREKLGI